MPISRRCRRSPPPFDYAPPAHDFFFFPRRHFLLFDSLRAEDDAFISTPPLSAAACYAIDARCFTPASACRRAIILPLMFSRRRCDTPFVA